MTKSNNNINDLPTNGNFQINQKNSKKIKSNSKIDEN